MTTYIVTTSNWNDPAFWSGINETAPGHTLDLSALPSGYTVNFDDNSALLTISDGTTSFTIGDTTNGTEPEDVELGGSTSWNYFTTFRGSQGNDSLEGDNDSETFILGGGDDTVTDFGGASTVDGGDGNDSITTSTFGDTIDGGAGADTIFSAGGNDTVSGGAGNDLIDTGAGNDSVDGGDGADSILGDAGNDTIYGGAGSDTIDGGAGADLIFGGDDDDILFGGINDDTILGGRGDDIVTLGEGRDLFLFRGASGNDTITDFDFTRDTIDIDFPGVNSFADVQPLMSQDAADTVIAFADGSSIRLNNINTGDLSASNFTFSGTVACFAPGTLIDTPDRPRAVETLRSGDLVDTMDHGPRAIRWIRSADYALEEVEMDAKPVLIAAGALGHRLPAQDLVVSPQHRILVGGQGQLQNMFPTEVLVPAKSLTPLPGIRHMNGKSQITWVHFAFDSHEIVVANGCLSESLLLGPMVIKSMTAAERQTIIDIFGAASSPDAALNGSPARELVPAGVARRQMKKLAEIKQHLMARNQGQRVSVKGKCVA